MASVLRTDTDNTLRAVSEIAYDKVWRPITGAGLSTGVNQAQTNLVQKATTTVAALAAGSSGGNVPQPLLSVTAVESPSKQHDRTYSEVSVTFTRNTSDANFGTVKIWFEGYQGSSTAVLMAEGDTSPITFLCESTGETVTVLAQPASPSGLTDDLSTAASTSVALDGVVSAPPAPTVSQSLLATPTGYQFQFAYEGGLLADVIQGYNIYRNTSNTTSGATLIKNVSQPAQNSGSYTYQETVPNGTVYYYFVSSVNLTGLESLKTSAQSGQVIGGFVPSLTGNDGVSGTNTGQNLVFNGNFAIATIPTGVLSTTASAIRVTDTAGPSPNGWTRNFEGGTEGFIYQAPGNVAGGGGLVGPNAMVMQSQNASASKFAAISDAFSVRAGTLYTFSANVNVGLGSGFPAHAQWFFRVYWYKVAATDFTRGSADLVSFNDIVSGSTASGVQAPSASFAAPAGAGFARITFYEWNDGTIPASAWNFIISNVRCTNTLDDTSDGTARFGATASTLTYRPLTNPVTATDAGANATVSVAAFTMRTSSKGDISVNSGSVTALSYSTTYYIYYDDASLAGGAVTYAASTVKETAIQGGGRFFVGSVTTPAALAPLSSGNNDGGTGAQSGQTTVFLGGSETTVITTLVAFTGLLTNFFDGNLTTKLSMASSSTTGASSGQIKFQGMSPTSTSWGSLKLNIRNAVPLNPSLCSVSLDYSLDAGNTFTNIYTLNAVTRALTTDTITLANNQNLALLMIRASISRASGTAIVQQDLYEWWVVGTT
jgi:hypothetical protein